MVDMLLNNQLVKDLGVYIKDNLGEDTMCIDISNKSSFARYMVVTSVSSTGRMRGLLKNVKDFLFDHGIVARNSRKKIDSEHWILLDCDDLVIHVFSRDKREFYELEKLWFDGEILFDDRKE